MAIDRVSLRLQSETSTVSELSDLLAKRPTRSTERGSALSSRGRSGNVHSVTTVVYEATAHADDLESYVAVLRSLLDRLGDRPVVGDVSADLIVAVTGDPLGFMASLDPATVRLLGTAGCGIVFDAYGFQDPDT
jgi:hypothetical protein